MQKDTSDSTNLKAYQDFRLDLNLLVSDFILHTGNGFSALSTWPVKKELQLAGDLPVMHISLLVILSHTVDKTSNKDVTRSLASQGISVH